MNRSVAKKNAAVFLILLVGILFLLAVYPLRLFTTTATLTGEGTIVASSDPVDADNDAGDYFTAQYSHLDILETWIEEVEKEGSVTLRLAMDPWRTLQRRSSSSRRRRALSLSPSMSTRYRGTPISTSSMPTMMRCSARDMNRRPYRTGGMRSGISRGFIMTRASTASPWQQDSPTGSRSQR